MLRRFGFSATKGVRVSDHASGAAIRQASAIRSAILAAMIGSCLILVSVMFIDRPVARFMAAHVHDRLAFMAMAAVANLPGPLAMLGLAGIVAGRWLGVVSGGTIASRGERLLITVAIATLVAIMLKNQLKFDFGRVWPLAHPLPGIDNRPSFIGDHVFGFFPFHGGSSFASFPSGHTTAITAPMAVLWILVPRYRVLWGALVGIVVVGLIGADFHFVSDTIAGFMVGVVTAAGTITVARSRHWYRP